MTPSKFVLSLVVCSLQGETWDEQFLQTALKGCESAKNNKGVFDWQWVEKSVAASEPARLADIADHIKFQNKWGGGIDQHLVRDCMDFIEAKMPSGRIISGSFFAELGSLKFAPADMMPHTVYAVVYAQAVLNGRIKENVGQTIEKNHVKSLTTSKKDAGIRINTMITNARHVMFGRGRTRRDINIECGSFGVDLVKCMFDIDKDDKGRATTLEEVAERHASVFVGISTADACDATTPCAAAARATATLTFNDGDDRMSNAGQLTLTSHGFHVNTTIEHKSNNAEDSQQQYAIKYINEDGSAGVHVVKPDGSVDESNIQCFSLDDLVHKMRPSKARVELFSDYPVSAVSSSKAWNDFVMQSCVTWALLELQNDQSVDVVTFRPQKKPTNKLFITTAANKGELRIVPLTTKIIVNPQKKNTANADAKVVIR